LFDTDTLPTPYMSRMDGETVAAALRECNEGFEVTLA
jgi:hypothetical protein